MTLVGCVLVAGGSGLRLGHDRPKALVEVGGTTLLEHAVRSLLAPDPATGTPVVDRLVVVAPVTEVSRCAALVSAALVAAADHGPAQDDPPVVVPGGADRQASVRAGLEALDPRCAVVLVHDAARAFVPASLVAAVAAAVLAGQDAVVPGLPLTDTVKELAPVDGAGLPSATGRAVLRTLDRSTLVTVQTPQGFRADLLRDVHGLGRTEQGPRSDGGAGDDAGMVEAAGGRVTVVPGHADAFKVTVPFDLLAAEALLAHRGTLPGAPGGGADRLPD